MNAGSTGTCPHCEVRVRFELISVLQGASNYGQIASLRFRTNSGFILDVTLSGCPACHKPILRADLAGVAGKFEEPGSLLWPETGSRLIPREVEDQAPGLAADFREAAAVFARSKKASAALSRRCLQFVLQEKAGTRSRDLSKQIDEVLEKLPSELAANVDAIRHIGNFAAHPIKATSSGEIVQVEEGEAEWLLDVLEELFDYYYVAPTKAAARRKLLNEKLESMGKPLLKARKDSD